MAETEKPDNRVGIYLNNFRMKKIKSLGALLLLLLVLLSCEKDETNKLTESVISQGINEETGSSRVPGGTKIGLITYYSGALTVFYDSVDPLKVIGYACTGMGQCVANPFTSDIIYYDFNYHSILFQNKPGITTDTRINFEERELKIRFLEPHITIGNVIEAAEGLGLDIPNTQIENTFNILNKSIKFDDIAVLSDETSEFLLGFGETKINILPGEYPVDFSNSEYGEITVSIELN